MKSNIKTNARVSKMTEPFTVEQAAALLHATVVRLDVSDPISITDIGVVCGLLLLNDEVEIVIKFADRISQYTRFEYLDQFRQVEPI